MGGAEEGVEFDLGDQDHVAGQRAQRVGQALLFPAIGLAALCLEKIERRREVGDQPVPAPDVHPLHACLRREEPR